MLATSPALTAPSAAAEIQLAVQGMTCAACAVRIEKKLNRLAGVTATVSFATERAIIAASAPVTVPDLIGAVEAAGYTATVSRGPGGASASGPAGDGSGAGDGRPADDGAEAAAAGAAYLRRRLVLALFFFVPLSDLSVQFSLFPWFRFAGWQWLLVALAAPVALWAAWPFHRAALRNARHLSSSMDTLVSLGIVSACGWSAYAMFFLDRGRSGAPLQQLAHGSGGGIYLEVAAAVTTFLLAGRFYAARAGRRAAGRRHDRGPAGGEDRGGRPGAVRPGGRRHLDDDGREHPGRGRRGR